MKKIAQLTLIATLFNATNSYSGGWENLKSWFGFKQPYDYKPSEEYLNKKHAYLQDQSNKQKERIEDANYYYAKDPSQKWLQIIKNRESELKQLELRGNRIYAEVAKKEANQQKSSILKSIRSWFNPTPGPEYKKLETQEIIRKIEPLHLETNVILPDDLQYGKSYQLKNINDDIYIKRNFTKKSAADIEEKQKQSRKSQARGQWNPFPIQPADVPKTPNKTYLTPAEEGLTYLRSFYLQQRRSLEKTPILPQDSE